MTLFQQRRTKQAHKTIFIKNNLLQVNRIIRTSMILAAQLKASEPSIRLNFARIGSSREIATSRIVVLSLMVFMSSILSHMFLKIIRPNYARDSMKNFTAHMAQDANSSILSKTSSQQPIKSRLWSRLLLKPHLHLVSLLSFLWRFPKFQRKPLGSLK